MLAALPSHRSSLVFSGEPPAMGSRSGGRHRLFLRFIALSSLLLIAAGEVIFEERFEGNNPAFPNLVLIAYQFWGSSLRMLPSLSL
jgi:hypothetical protein